MGTFNIGPCECCGEGGTPDPAVVCGCNCCCGWNLPDLELDDPRCKLPRFLMFTLGLGDTCIKFGDSFGGGPHAYTTACDLCDVIAGTYTLVRQDHEATEQEQIDCELDPGTIVAGCSYRLLYDEGEGPGCELESDVDTPWSPPFVFGSGERFEVFEITGACVEVFSGGLFHLQFEVVFYTIVYGTNPTAVNGSSGSAVAVSITFQSTEGNAAEGQFDCSDIGALTWTAAFMAADLPQLCDDDGFDIRLVRAVDYYDDLAGPSQGVYQECCTDQADVLANSSITFAA